MRKIMSLAWSLVRALLVVFVFISYGQAQPAVEPVPVQFPPPLPPEAVGPGDLLSPAIEKVSPGVFKIGDITINKNTQGLAFPALVNMDKGLLEYLIVQARGKTHESLLRTKVEPYHLQIAFLLLGFEGSDKPLRFQGDPEKPKGDPVEIAISYQNKDGKAAEIKAQEWVAKGNQAGLKSAGNIDWVYTGSVVLDGRFLAQIEASIAAIFHDPVAIIDNVTEGGESDKLWFVKEGTVPPVGTPVTVTIKKKSKK